MILAMGHEIGRLDCSKFLKMDVSTGKWPKKSCDLISKMDLKYQMGEGYTSNSLLLQYLPENLHYVLKT